MDLLFEASRNKRSWQAVSSEDLDEPILQEEYHAESGTIEAFEIEKQQEFEFDEGGNVQENNNNNNNNNNNGRLGGNLTSAVLGIIKGMVGPAILYLPHGFASAGFVVALPIMALATLMYLHSSSCLLQAWKSATEQNQTTSYPELAGRALGPIGKSAVKWGVALMQSGVCLTYLIFVPHNLHTSMHAMFGIQCSPEGWLIFMIMVQIPLSWIRDIRLLTSTNFVANAMILYGLLTCLGFALEEASAANPQLGLLDSLYTQFTQLSAFRQTWFLFIGTSVLLFEGSITLLIPLQESVQDVEQRKKFPFVYRFVILGIISFYLVFGITCWMSFGDDVNTVLTTSLPTGNLATSVQLAYSIAVVFTFPLQNFPALDICCPIVGDFLAQRGFPTSRNVLTSLSVVCLAWIAYSTMDALDKVVSLMGGLLGCPIAFVLPPLIHDHTDTTNRIVAALGILSMIFATINTLLEW